LPTGTRERKRSRIGLGVGAVEEKIVLKTLSNREVRTLADKMTTLRRSSSSRKKAIRNMNPSGGPGAVDDASERDTLCRGGKRSNGGPDQKRTLIRLDLISRSEKHTKRERKETRRFAGGLGSACLLEKSDI